MPLIAHIQIKSQLRMLTNLIAGIPTPWKSDQELLARTKGTWKRLPSGNFKKSPSPFSVDHVDSNFPRTTIARNASCHMK